MRRPLLLPVLFAVLAAAPGCSESPPPAADPGGGADGEATARGTRTNVILISLDTLRADHLGAYGYERDTSPHLDRLARRGVTFNDVLTQSTSTMMAHKSIFSAALPSMHRGSLNEFDTLVQRLAASGYHTAAFVDGGFLRARFGHSEGFDVYVDDLAEAAPKGRRPVADRQGGGFAAILPAAEEWLSRRPPGAFFLFLHTYDVHCPYESPAEYAFLFTDETAPPMDISGMCGKSNFRGMALTEPGKEWIRAQYDAGIRYTDNLLGDFLARLEADGTLDDTVVAVISDHGESLGEQDWFGHNRLYPSQLFVPWIMAGPGLPLAKALDVPAQLVDLVPTLLDYLELPPLRLTFGASLMPAVRGEDPFPDGRLRVSEIRVARALVKGEWLLIQQTEDGAVRSLKRRQGGEEAADLQGSHPEVTAALLEEWTAAAAAAGVELGVLPDQPEVSEEKIRRELRTLGYVD